MRSKLKSENGFFDFLRGFKNKKGSWRLLVILLVGVVLLVFGGGVSSGGTAEGSELDKYGAALEARIAELCSSLEGVGKSRAMITFSSGERTLYEGSRAVGTRPPEVMAVTVLCEGADDERVVARLTEMLASMLGVGTNRVKIMKLSL